ncbi:MAG: LptF/LptG family permease [Bacteroidetes bacterium]|nr:LptF/LptG family permease [Bacteroidota bacterium]
MLKKLDRYIISKFLSTFFYSLGLISAVSIIIDLAEKIDDFIQNNASTHQLIFDYYIYFIPWFYNLFNNLFVFISVIFFTSRLAMNSEIIAMLAGGVSFRRLLRPYMIAASILAVLSYFMNTWVTPYCNEQKVAFENQYINGRRHEEQWMRNVHRQLQPGVYMFIDNFSKRDSIGYKFTLEKFEGRELVYKLASERFSFDQETGKWRVENYTERDFKSDSSLRKGENKDIDIAFNPHEFFLRKDDVGIYSTPELNRIIKAEKMRGAEKIEFYLVEKYRRLAMPFSTLILTLIGFGISSRKMKSGIGMHLGFGLALAFSFIFVSQLTFTFAYSGDLPPLLAVWIPNIIYLVIGLVLFRYAPK